MTVRALFFDVFGTLVDWRTGVARDAETLLRPLGHAIDWLAFADAWRAEYQPAMTEVREGRIAFCKLDVLHRKNLEAILPRFGLQPVPPGVLADLNLAWHRLDGWPDSAPGLARLKRKFAIAPVSNGNISLMVDLARRNGFPWDAILGSEVAGDFKPLVGYEKLGPAAMLSIPTPDHYLPLLYVVATQQPGENITFPVEGVDGGSISMLSVRVGPGEAI